MSSSAFRIGIAALLIAGCRTNAQRRAAMEGLRRQGDRVFINASQGTFDGRVFETELMVIAGDRPVDVPIELEAGKNVFIDDVRSCTGDERLRELPPVPSDPALPEYIVTLEPKQSYGGTIRAKLFSDAQTAPDCIRVELHFALPASEKPLKLQWLQPKRIPEKQPPAPPAPPPNS